MPELNDNASMTDYQHYVSELEIERGFSGQSARDKCLLLGEEVGELFKAIRKAEGLAIDASSEIGDIEEELADIFIYLCSIANRYQINLNAAFLNKEKKNKQRRWGPAQ